MKGNPEPGHSAWLMTPDGKIKAMQPLQPHPSASELERIASRRAENKIKAAMEHLAHLWCYIVKEYQIEVIDPDSWPPQVEWTVQDFGTIPYHALAVLEMINSVHQMILENETGDQ